MAPLIFKLGRRFRRLLRVMNVQLYPRERTPGSHCEGGWLDFRTGPKGLEKEEISHPVRESNFIKGVAV